MKKITNLQNEEPFIWLNVIVWDCASGIVFKLVLGWTDWSRYTGVVAIASLIGTLCGISIKEADDINHEKVKVLNPFRKKVWPGLLVASSIITIIDVFLACVLFDAEWKIVIGLAFITTWLACEISYVLSGRW